MCGHMQDCNFVNAHAPGDGQLSSSVLSSCCYSGMHTGTLPARLEQQLVEWHPAAHRMQGPERHIALAKSWSFQSACHHLITLHGAKLTILIVTQRFGIVSPFCESVSAPAPGSKHVVCAGPLRGSLAMSRG